MTVERTEPQSPDEQQQARERSRVRSRPPLEIPGYEPRQFLGAGAYGEVWVAIDQNTGRRVAIKFYTHQGGVDFALLASEVEKLVFLSADRYVVQLLDVGWDANPPYYVMEYVENGSLEDYLQEHGPLPVGEAVEMFREVATGLLRSHGKGVLHCDLKPANVLLDQEHQPRLADFGQSRLSCDQTPALGTLFFMAPEQADLDAVPDARWDVYALGALLHCMLTGDPPHRSSQAISQIDSTPDLNQRLQWYRELIREARPPELHRQRKDVDRALSEILQRCLAVDPEERYPTVQSVLEALRARDIQRDRRPLVILGLLGPLLFLLVTAMFAYRSYLHTVDNSDRLLLRRAEESNGFAADFVAEAVARRIEGYFRAVEEVASRPELKKLILQVEEDPQLAALLRELAREDLAADALTKWRAEFLLHPNRQSIAQWVGQLLQRPYRPEVASWFVTNAEGIHLAASFDVAAEASPVGGNFSYRTYFHGGTTDERPADHGHIEQTHLSTVFQSTATGTWKVAISTPVMEDGAFLGIVALTVELGRLGEMLGGSEGVRQFNVLVDGREGDSRGVILQHPLFMHLLQQQGYLDAEFSTAKEYRVPLDHWGEERLYVDPLGHHPQGQAYRRRWIAAKRQVLLEPEKRQAAGSNAAPQDTGLIVIVQEDYDLAAAPIYNLGRSLVRQGLLAFSVVMLVVGVLWYFVTRAIRDPNETLRRRQGGPRSNSTTLHNMETIELPPRLRT